ncbi:MAG: TolC family protein, partial [Phycisphaerales bacterium]|nr:TolC family protein [Phycisphaerales bacterium]
MNKYLSKHASMRVAALCTSALLVSSGCQQGLFDNDDSQWRVPDEKLQEIERLDVDAALRAPRESLDDATKRAVDEVIPKVERTDEVLLSLSDVRSAVLANNLDLRTQLISPAIASAALAQEEAKFQSVFFANWDRNDGNLLSDLSGGDNIDQDAFNAGVNIPLATGGTVSFSAPFAQAASGFGAPDEDWQGGLSASMSQPLLRNAGVDVNTASIRVARWQGQIADARTKLEAVRILAASDRAYWNFYSAYRELDVRRKQYEVALEQLERAKRRVRGGDAAEIEVIRAESGVGGTLQSIIVADATLRIRQRELKRLMARDDLPVAGSTPMKPASEPNPVGLKLDAAVLAKKAIAGRMEMLELELQLAVDLTNIDLARNQELPLFMLDYGYTLQGQGSSFDDAYAQIGNADQFNVGLSAEISLGNDAAKAAVSQAILTRVQRLATKDARR